MQPLEPANWSSKLGEIRAFLDTPLNIHKLMAHHPALLTAWMPLRNHVVNNSALTGKQRELIILRTACNCKADYEWQHHVERGLAAGLSRAEIERVKTGAAATAWLPDEAALLQAADDCHHDFQIGAGTLMELDKFFSAQQQLDISVTVGMYMTLALLIKTYAVPMERESPRTG